MTRTVRLFDVYLTATELDRAACELVRRGLEELGLNVFVANATKLPSGRKLEGGLREALMQSRVFAGVLSRSALGSDGFAFELGAAWGMAKPVYLITHEIDQAKIPTHYRKYHIEPISRHAEIARDIRHAAAPPSDEQIQTLISAYADLSIPADRLLDDPHSLDQLTERYNEAGSSQYSPDRVLLEIIRLRKAGKLSKLVRKSHGRKVS